MFDFVCFCDYAVITEGWILGGADLKWERDEEWPKKEERSDRHKKCSKILNLETSEKQDILKNSFIKDDKLITYDILLLVKCYLLRTGK